MTDRYDSDPDALAWARSKAQAYIDQLRDYEQQATASGKADQARGLAVARIAAERRLVGGEGCTIAAFDERRPEWAARIDAP